MVCRKKLWIWFDVKRLLDERAIVKLPECRHAKKKSYLIFLYRVSVAELSCHLFAPSTNFPPFRTTPSRHFRTPFLLSFLDSIVDDDRRPSTTDPSTCPFNQTMTSHGDGRQWQHQPMTKSTALSTACPAGLSSVKMYLDT